MLSRPSPIRRETRSAQPEEPAPPLPTVTIVEAISHPDLFARHFASASWDAWRMFLAGLFGLSMDDDQLALFRECTGLDEPPREAVNESLARRSDAVGARAVSSL